MQRYTQTLLDSQTTQAWLVWAVRVVSWCFCQLKAVNLAVNVRPIFRIPQRLDHDGLLCSLDVEISCDKRY